MSSVLTSSAVPQLDPTLLESATKWDHAASQYNISATTVTTPSAIWAFNKVLSLLQDKQPIVVADIACGTGALAYEAATRIKQVSKVIASDYSAGMCRIFDEKINKLKQDQGIDHVVDVHTVVADAQDLSFIPDASVDAVFCIFGLFMIPSPSRAMNEFLRICKPGGYICIVTWATYERSQLHGLFRSIAKHVTMKKATTTETQGTSATSAATSVSGTASQVSTPMPTSTRIPFSLASDYESLFEQVSLPLISVEEHMNTSEIYSSARSFMQRLAGSAPMGIMAYNQQEQQLAIEYLSDIWGAEAPFSLTTTAMVAIGQKHQ